MWLEWKRRVKVGAILIACLIIWGAIVLGSYVGYQRYQHLLADEAAFHTLIVIINTNIANGKLDLPPELKKTQPQP